MRYFFLLLSCCFFMPDASAQKLFKWLKVETDSAFISDRTRDITIRVLGGTKFTKYAFGEDETGKRIKYESNDHLNFGVGFNYRFLGLNLAFKMPFVNNDNDKYGKTKFLDIQTYIYMRKLVIDLYYQNYRGYYLQNKNVINTPYPSRVFPQRPDILTTHVGLNAQYVFNNRFFSYRASFIQNEYQKKSAGSFLAGAGIHYLRAKADSAILPDDLIFNGFFNDQAFNKTGYVSLGVTAGYAYTVVIHKNFFLTGAALGGIGANYSYLKDVGTQYYSGRVAPQLSGIFRLAAGYNSERYYAGVQYVNFVNKNYMPIDKAWQQYQTGYIRFTVAERFPLKGKMKKRVRKLEQQIKEKIN